MNSVICNVMTVVLFVLILVVMYTARPAQHSKGGKVCMHTPVH